MKCGWCGAIDPSLTRLAVTRRSERQRYLCEVCWACWLLRKDVESGISSVCGVDEQSDKCARISDNSK